MTLGFRLNLRKIVMTKRREVEKEVKGKISRFKEIPDMENALDK